MRLLTLQTALFVSGSIERPDLLANRINREFNNLFNDMPNIMNMPIELPPDIPVVQMFSTDRKHQINISRNRIDFFYKTPHPLVDSVQSSLTMLSPMIEQFYTYIIKKEKLPINRIGLIATLFLPEKDNVHRIAEKYFRNKGFEKCCEMSFRVNSRCNIKNHQINNILNVEANTLFQRQNNDEIQTPGIIVTIDTNNVPTEKLLTLSIAKSIIKHAENRLNEAATKEMI
ncbi:MAG: hypothetical protein IJC70_01745 [Firmicutes bacterium]|nr:hypothetical protein [Bacillota bacterium]